ncbi:HAD family hydrolase [Agarivorans litoreus]|uniref:HAD family hydrolase n=1 Tax=Agarivorans litoreus TaxID=1510455 RepID=UPI001C7D3A7B|nr:HAD-IA family hydrolase [Agarivorans litoreus]
MLNHNQFKAIIFDLDDTLYLEKDYVLSGFNAIAEELANYGISKDESYQYLYDYFDTKGRAGCLDSLLDTFKHIEAMPTIEELLLLYRSHQPTIRLSELVKTTLTKIQNQGIKTAIVTDGLGQMQKNKVAALELEKYVDHFIYCWDLGAPKPAIEGFKLALSKLQCPAENCILVGDNPEHDIKPAYQLGIYSIRLLQGRFKNIPDNQNYPANQHCLSVHTLFET